MLVYFLDHPFYLGLQAHPELCTRPLNPSPPFLGFVAAACGEKVLKEQIAFQQANFQPHHPVYAMVSEEELRKSTVLRSSGDAINGAITPPREGSLLNGDA